MYSNAEIKLYLKDNISRKELELSETETKFQILVWGETTFKNKSEYLKVNNFLTQQGFKSDTNIEFRFFKLYSRYSSTPDLDEKDYTEPIPSKSNPRAVGPIMKMRRFPDNYLRLSDEERKKSDFEFTQKMLDESVKHRDIVYYQEVEYPDDAYLKPEVVVEHDQKTLNFIEKVRVIHNDAYDYTKTVYVRNKEKLIVTCKIHGDFSIQANNHLYGKYGCKFCKANERNGIVELPKPKIILENQNNEYSNEFLEFLNKLN